MSNILFGLLAITILFWVGLTMWRQAGSELMQRIEQDTLVAIPPEEVQEIDGTGGLQAVRAKIPKEQLPFSAYGIMLARISGSWFHGAFAVVSLVLAFFAFTTRTR